MVSVVSYVSFNRLPPVSWWDVTFPTNGVQKIFKSVPTAVHVSDAELFNGMSMCASVFTVGFPAQ